MEPEKQLQPDPGEPNKPEKEAGESGESTGVATVPDRRLVLEKLLRMRAQFDPEFAARNGAGRALTKASKALLSIDERCKGLTDVLDVSEQIDQHVMLLDEGRKMERKARRLECLRAAHLAPRCEHIKPNGMRCGSPAAGGEKFCFFHGIARNNAVEFPIVEDRRGLQAAILRVCERLANGTISAANGKILLAGLSMAAENARDIAREDGEI